MSHSTSIRKFLACSSRYGRFGIGLHFAQLVEETRNADELYGYAATQIRSGDERLAFKLKPATRSVWTKIARRGQSQGQIYDRVSRFFEASIVACLPDGPTTLMTFAGRSLEPIRRSKQLGYEAIELVSPTSHVTNVIQRHSDALNDTGMKDSWLTSKTHDRILQEYEEADRIYVHSDYTMKSFLNYGVAPEKLCMTNLVPNPRFIPSTQKLSSDTFNVVYVGRVDSSKGIHLLIKAFQRMQRKNASLRIVGGCTSRAMKNYIQREIVNDPRIRVGPGDPLPILHRANVLVHCSYEDGFSYAPVEALCAGVPVIVTEDTGMKEFVVSGDNGYIVPTGEIEPLVQCLDRIAGEPLDFNAVAFRERFYPTD